MPTSGKSREPRSDLRRIAEAKLQHAAPPPAKAPRAKAPRAEAPPDPQRTLQELQVYQVELELQNEELRRTQADLEALRARYFDLYELAPVGYGTLDAEGRIKDVNQRAASLLGRPKAELQRAPMVRFVLPEDRDRYTGFCQGLDQGGARATCELRILRPDGPSLWVHLEGLRAKDGVGRPCLRLTLSDISELKRAQALGTGTEGILAKARMAAYVAHEINNPLTGIRNAFLLLDKAIPQEHPHFRYVAMIHQEIARIGNIVKTMYELHRPTNQVPTTLGLRTLLEEVAALLEPLARTHQASLQVELPEPTLQATLAADLVRQILFNLLQNALQASPPGGRVVCRASRQQDRLLIQVLDEGPGIAPERSAKIFEPGFTTKRQPGLAMGLGIGLSSSLQLARGMGGKLSFENRGPGAQGCTFTLDLPLESPVSEPRGQHDA